MEVIDLWPQKKSLLWQQSFLRGDLWIWMKDRSDKQEMFAQWITWDRVFPQLTAVDDRQKIEMVSWRQQQINAFYLSLGLSWSKKNQQHNLGMANLLTPEL